MISKRSNKFAHCDAKKKKKITGTNDIRKRLWLPLEDFRHNVAEIGSYGNGTHLQTVDKIRAKTFTQLH